MNGNENQTGNDMSYSIQGFESDEMFQAVTWDETASSELVANAGEIAEIKGADLAGAVVYVPGGGFRGVLVRTDLGDGEQLYIRWNSRAMDRTILSPIAVKVTARKFNWTDVGQKAVKAQVTFLDNDPEDQRATDAWLV